ncbi:hypothetical protein [Bacillus sp. 2205SS5-2]
MNMITPQQLQTKLSQSEPINIIDVREGEEVRNGRMAWEGNMV